MVHVVCKSKFNISQWRNILLIPASSQCQLVYMCLLTNRATVAVKMLCTPPPKLRFSSSSGRIELKFSTCMRLVTRMQLYKEEVQKRSQSQAAANVTMVVRDDFHAFFCLALPQINEYGLYLYCTKQYTIYRLIICSDLPRFNKYWAVEGLGAINFTKICRCHGGHHVFGLFFSTRALAEGLAIQPLLGEVAYMFYGV